jgi:hypothetical protein
MLEFVEFDLACHQAALDKYFGVWYGLVDERACRAPVDEDAEILFNCFCFRGHNCRSKLELVNSMHGTGGVFNLDVSA